MIYAQIVNNSITYIGDEPSRLSLPANEDGVLYLELPSAQVDTIDYVYKDGALVYVAPPVDKSLYTLDIENLVWLLDLEKIKAQAWIRIKHARSQAEFGTFTYSGMTFDGDQDAQRRLNGYISISKGALASATEFQASFTLADNTEVVLTAMDFVNIELAKVQQVALAFAHGVALREQIEAATTPGEVAAVVW